MSRQETRLLAEYAASLRYEEIPVDVVEIAKSTIIDGVAACVYGFRFPWSQSIFRYAASMGGSHGACSVLGPGGDRLAAPFAALVNGALAHSFELDGGTRQGVGAHPFGTVFTAALPVAQLVGASGRDLITAFVAGSEALLRIGKATRRSNEHRGFHAPGTTGPFGAAIACSLLYRSDREQLLDAIGIAGSLASGLRQFSKSSSGGMVKRLHFGRAAESGVLAASLAREGLDGPHDILEGQAGFLRVFCEEFDLNELVRGLDGKTFHMREISMKHFATHGSTQAPLNALLSILAENSIRKDQIREVRVVVSRETVENHNETAPKDLMQAQYSVPFCVALACVRDIRDPRSISEDALFDPEVLGMLSRVRVEINEVSSKRTCRVIVQRADGREYERLSPEDDPSWKPIGMEEAAAKYRMLMSDLPPPQSELILSRLQSLETQINMDWMIL